MFPSFTGLAEVGEVTALADKAVEHGAMRSPRLGGGWLRGGAKTRLDTEVNGGTAIWPEFDVLPDGRTLTAAIEIHDTAVWTVNLTYVEK